MLKIPVFFSLILYCSPAVYSQDSGNKKDNRVDLVKGIHKPGFSGQTFYVEDDDDGNIWVSSEFGVYRSDRSEIEKIDWFADKAEVLKIFSSKDKLFFFHKNFELTVYDQSKFETFKIKKFDLLNSFEYKHIHDIEFDAVKGELIILADFNNNSAKQLFLIGVGIHNMSVNKVITIRNQNQFNKHDCILDGQNVILYDTYNSLCMLLPNGDSTIDFSRSVKKNLSVFHLEQYEVLLELNQLLLKDKVTNETFQLVYDGKLCNLIQDYEGNIWLSTVNDGLWFFEMNFKDIPLQGISNVDYGNRFAIKSEKKISVMFSKRHGFYMEEIAGAKRRLYQNTYFLLYTENDTLTIGYNALKSKFGNYKFKVKINESYVGDSFVYLGLSSGLYRYSLINGKLIQLTKLSVSSLTQNPYSGLIVFTGGKNIYELGVNGRVSIYHKGPENIRRISGSIHGVIVASEKGVYLVNKNKVHHKLSELDQIKHIRMIGDELFLSDNNWVYNKKLNSRTEIRETKLLVRSELNSKPGEESVLINRTLNIYSVLKSNYNKRGKIHYALVRGKDTVYKNVVDQGSISIGNLEHGQYQLMLFGENDLGLFSKKYVYQISVTPFFYEKSSFKILILLLSVLLISIVVYTIYHNQKKRMLNYQLVLENENYQLQLMKSQLNPHFLFNALNSLKSLIYLNKNDDAISYTDKVSQFLRSILSTNKDLKIKLSDELETINHYINVEKFRLRERLDLDLKIQELMGSKLIPSNILQPIVENSIKYGLSNELSCLRITIEVKNEGQVLQIMVKDNGITNTSVAGSGNSFSLKSIQHRVDMFNRGKVPNCLVLREISFDGVKTGMETVIRVVMTDE